jgi:CopG family nickel-responsive transcriptional regulator
MSSVPAGLAGRDIFPVLKAYLYMRLRLRRQAVFSQDKGIDMGGIVRFGVSIETELLNNFDVLCNEKGYGNRSEAIRDLIRKSLVEGEWSKNTGDVAATLTLVYNHHKSGLAQKLTRAQHDAHHLIVSTLHVHLDHDNCLEVLVLKGKSEEIQSLSGKLSAIKGILLGEFSRATTAQHIC